eukprot:Em0003g324a
MQPAVQASSSNSLFERVIHYDSPQPSPAIAPRRMRFRSSVAPSPPTSHKSESTERLQQQHGNDDIRETTVATSLAIAPAGRPYTSSKKINEDKYKLLEEKEEQEISKRRRETLERFLLRSSQEKVPASRRSRTRHTESRPSTFNNSGQVPSQQVPESRVSQRRKKVEPEVEAAMGDAEASTPTAVTPPVLDDLPASPRPGTKKRRLRRKLNQVGHIDTDGYDSTDRPQRRAAPLSRQNHSRKSKLKTTSRVMSRGKPLEARQRDLAWVDMGGGGVQLMRVQPLQHIFPGHPQLVSVQPRVPRPTLERLPVLPTHSDSYNQQQFEQVRQIHREMERIEQSEEAPCMTNHTPDATPHQMSGSQQHTLNHAPSTGEGHKIEERSGATPPGSTGMPNLDSSNSTQELLQQAFTPISQPPIRDHFMVSEATPVPIPMYYGNATPDSGVASTAHVHVSTTIPWSFIPCSFLPNDAHLHA